MPTPGPAQAAALQSFYNKVPDERLNCRPEQLSLGRESAHPELVRVRQELAARIWLTIDPAASKTARSGKVTGNNGATRFAIR